MAQTKIRQGQTDVASATMTLTNKTLTNPTINFTDSAVDQNVLFSAYRSTTAQSVGSSSMTDIIFNAENFDIGSDYNTATGIFTVPVTGYYLFNATLSFDGITDGKRAIVQILSGATDVASQQIHASYTQDINPTVSCIIYCTATTQIKVQGYQDTGSAKDVRATNTTNFSGVLLSV